MGDTHGENVFMEWKDPDPIRVNYVGVMTGWGAEGDWELEPVDNPRVITKREGADNDACLQSRPEFHNSKCSD